MSTRFCSRSLTAATDSGIAPRWTGMCSACMTIWPRRSKSAVEASRRSLMFAECAARTSTAPISSQVARSAPLRTWRVTASSGRGHRRCSSTSVPLSRTSAAPAGWNDDGRLRQLADRGPFELVAHARAPSTTAVSRRSPPKTAGRVACVECALSELIGPVPGARLAGPASRLPRRRRRARSPARAPPAGSL